MKIKTKEDALYEIIEEIVTLLNYQAEVPYKHKQDLAEKFRLFQEAMKSQD